MPRTAAEIQNRVDEIAFNASLLKDLRVVDFVRRLIEAGRLEAGEYQRVRVHRIHDAKTLVPLGSSSKLNAEWAFLTSLRDAGRRAADIEDAIDCFDAPSRANASNQAIGCYTSLRIG